MLLKEAPKAERVNLSQFSFQFGIPKNSLTKLVSGSKTVMLESSNISYDPLADGTHGIAAYKHEATPISGHSMFEIRLSPFAISEEAIPFDQIKNAFRFELRDGSVFENIETQNIEYINDRLLCVDDYYKLVTSTPELQSLSAKDSGKEQSWYSDGLEDYLLDDDFESNKEEYAARDYGDYASRLIAIFNSLKYYARKYELVLINNQSNPVETMDNDTIAVLLTHENFDSKKLERVIDSIAQNLVLEVPLRKRKQVAFKENVDPTASASKPDNELQANVNLHSALLPEVPTIKPAPQEPKAESKPEKPKVASKPRKIKARSRPQSGRRAQSYVANNSNESYTQPEVKPQSQNSEQAMPSITAEEYKKLEAQLKASGALL